jgi:hypothetical protein
MNAASYEFYAPQLLLWPARAADTALPHHAPYPWLAAQPHYDYFHDTVNARPENGGQRVATVLMYLCAPH